MTTPENPFGADFRGEPDDYLLYKGLVVELLKQDNLGDDGSTYYQFDIPQAETGGLIAVTGVADNYMHHLLQASHDIREKRQNDLMAAFEAGEDIPLEPIARRQDGRDLLEQGLAVISLKTRGAGDEHSLLIARPEDLVTDDPFTREIVAQAEADSEADRPFVYDFGPSELVAAPFSEPHLRALCNYLRRPER
jgi:hypothetical protein